MHRPLAAGFSLIEIAIVLLIIGLISTAILVPLGGAFEQSRRRATTLQLEEVNRALIGFAVAKERLPCPASGTSAGAEAPPGGGACTGADAHGTAHGFVPAATLGLFGEVNADGLLLDSWGNPIRYTVTQVNTDPGRGPDFTTQGGMRATGLSNLRANIVICTRAAQHDHCPESSGDGNTVRANEIPALVLSLGADWREFSGADQLANAGERKTGGTYTSVISTASGFDYPVPGDNIFVSNAFNQIDGEGKFDDIVMWLSENILYTRLIQAGVLP